MKPLLEVLEEAADTAELAYTDPAGQEQFPPGSIQEALLAAELLRLRALDSLEFSESVRNVGIELQQEKPDTSNSPIQALRTSRRCLNPAGLHFTNGENTIAPCGKCPECRRWDAMVDAYRAIDAITDGVVTYIPEAKWSATVKRLNRKGLNYLAKPIEGRRLLVVDGDFEGPVAGPAKDLVGLFLSTDEKRDRENDRRQTSHSKGVRSRKAVEREAFPPKEEEPRQIAGYFSPKLVSHSAVINEVIDELEKIAQAAKVPYERDGTTVRVLVGRHDPRAEFFYQRIGVNWLDSTIPWYQGGPPPNPGDPGWEAWEKAKAAQWHPFSDSPPDWVYDRDAAAIYEEHWVA